MVRCSASTSTRNTTPASPTSSGCPSRRWMWTGNRPRRADLERWPESIPAPPRGVRSGAAGSPAVRHFTPGRFGLPKATFSAKHANPYCDYGGRRATRLRALALFPLRRFPREKTIRRGGRGLLCALLLQPFGATGDSYGGGDFLPCAPRSPGIGERRWDVERDPLGGIARRQTRVHFHRLHVPRNARGIYRAGRMRPHRPVCRLEVRRGMRGADLRQDTGDPDLVLLAAGFAVRRDGCVHVENAHQRMCGADCGALDLNGDRSRECRRSPAESV